MVCCFLVSGENRAADAVRSSLDELGLTVRQANTAHELIAKTRGQRCDVMLMPDCEETDVYLSRVRLARGAHVPVMIYAQNADVVDITGAIADGASEYLLAPFSSEMMRFKLKQVGLLV